jgi:hypothetical protein
MMPSGMGGSMVSPRPLRSSSPFWQLRRRSTAMCMGDLDVIFDVATYFYAVSNFNFYVRTLRFPTLLFSFNKNRANPFFLILEDF